MSCKDRFQEQVVIPTEAVYIYVDMMNEKGDGKLT